MGKLTTAMLKRYKPVLNRFDKASAVQKIVFIQRAARAGLTPGKLLVGYFEALLYICAHPDDPEVLAVAEKELARLTAWLKKLPDKAKKPLLNSGLPFVSYSSSFSHDFLCWLLRQPSCKISGMAWHKPVHSLNEVLAVTLPAVERAETTAGLDNDNLLDMLGVKKNERLAFIIRQLDALNATPGIKDLLFDALGLYVDFAVSHRTFSKAYNRFLRGSVWFQKDLLRHFDYRAVIDAPLPSPARLSKEEYERLATVIKTSLALCDRETDTVTYLDTRSLRLFELDRGISVALYGMTPDRQLPLESYIGYTLFKNGFPAAYGGGWVFGEKANFGINIFESFRGGESGYLFSLLLRTYRQAFGVTRFEIEPYQFGLDNPEGISSGAFWFYYRYGFRPLDGTLKKIAAAEYRKKINRKGTRTPAATLVRFTQSPMVLWLDRERTPGAGQIAGMITAMIGKRYQGNRKEAVESCVAAFNKKTGTTNRFLADEKSTLEDTALWAAAMEIRDAGRLKLMARMVKTKPRDLYKYQDLLVAFFEKHPKGKRQP